MKKTCLIIFSCISCHLGWGLPQGVVVESGDMQVHHESPTVMRIDVLDKTILSYESFDVALGEHVQFMQPSSTARVLARVRGTATSHILGALESNGRVILINPHGIYVGKEAIIRMNSFIASTAQMANEDFLQDRYLFHAEEDAGKIVQQGEIHTDGLLALIAPRIHNEGLLLSSVGSVILASGKHVTLTFAGDDYLSFAVEGVLEESLIEQAGHVEAVQGQVAVRVATATRALREVVNRSAIETGEVFMEENGEILLVSASTFLAKQVHIQGPRVEIAGSIDAMQHIIVDGGDIYVHDAQLNASETIQIGGAWQGKGPVASRVTVDALTRLSAHEPGGTIVLWSEQETICHGQLQAQGGRIETSSYGYLDLDGILVDTTSKQGALGIWLLDPVTLTISATGATIPSGCSTTNTQIAVSNIENASASVFLCANTIIQEVPISMMVPGAGIVFSTPSSSDIGTLALSGNVLTKGGSITVSHMHIELQGATLLDTTNGSSLGNSISLGDVDGAHAFTCLAGDSQIALGTLGAMTPLKDVTVVASNLIIESISTDNAAMILDGLITLGTDVILDSAAHGEAGGLITLGKVNALPLGGQSLTIRSGVDGTIFLHSIGESSPVTTLSIPQGKEVFVQDLFVTHSINIEPPIRLQLEKQTFETLLPLALNEEIALGTIDGLVDNIQSLTIHVDDVTKVSLGDVGKQVPLNTLAIQAHQEVFLNSVYATTVEIESGEGAIVFQKEVMTTGEVLISGGSLSIQDRVQGERLSLESFGPILSLDASQALFGGEVRLNSLYSSLGSESMPLYIATAEQVTIGAQGSAFLSGDVSKQTIQYINTNTPCTVVLNGNQINNCHRSLRTTFSTLGTAVLRLQFATAASLGIGYNPLPFQVHSLSSFLQQIYLLSEEGSFPRGFLGL